ncbi:hypothetical protein L950_0229575 [Sphingobacterium sp. IITKGP-BTPF85]|nr:hypothetical protein L950_0229575 [Sphingobacterium sp. IITKGP-BTPF85]
MLNGVTELIMMKADVLDTSKKSKFVHITNMKEK